jgi:hypothetical protein
MRRLPPVTDAMIAVIMFLVSPTSALAQTASPKQEANQWNRTPECIVAPVRDAPFSAEAVTVWLPSPNSGRAELQSIARYYRDRAGRVRVDFVGGMTPQRVIVTPDADSNVAYLLDTVARAAISGTRGLVAMIVGGGCFDDHFVLPLSMNRFVGFLGRRLDEESLGEESMGGVRVTGTRFNTMLPASVTGMALGERWVSPELRLLVYSRREDSVVGVVEHQLRKISLTDPPAQLFDVPTDYVEATFSCMTWENPYAPNTSRRGCGHR